MRKRILFSIIFLLIASIAGFMLMSILLPPPLAEGVTKLFLHVMAFVFVLSGPFSTVIVLSTYAPGFVIAIFILLGIISFIVWLAWLRNLSCPRWRLVVPILTWVLIGTLSTFWGLAAGV